MPRSRQSSKSQNRSLAKYQSPSWRGPPAVNGSKVSPMGVLNAYQKVLESSNSWRSWACNSDLSDLNMLKNAKMRSLKTPASIKSKNALFISHLGVVTRSTRFPMGGGGFQETAFSHGVRCEGENVWVSQGCSLFWRFLDDEKRFFIDSWCGGCALILAIKISQ